MGKGSKARPLSVPLTTFDSNWDAIFKKDKDMQVRVKENIDEVGRCGCGRSPTGKCIGWHGLSEDEFARRKELYETGKADLAGNEIK
jgi:hypothetical protein